MSGLGRKVTNAAFKATTTVLIGATVVTGVLVVQATYNLVSRSREQRAAMAQLAAETGANAPARPVEGPLPPRL